MSSTDPPYYILVSHSSSLNPSVAASSTLSHPIIEYHYADDSPNALLPRSPGEHIIVLDYDPEKDALPTVKSLSRELAVTGLKVTDAPGAGVADEELDRNSKMYVLETTAVPQEPEDEQMSVHAVLAHFKQRNALLRRVADYPNSSKRDPTSTTISPLTPSESPP